MTRSTPVDRVIEYCQILHDTIDSSRSCHVQIVQMGMTRSTPVDRVIEYCPKFHDTFDSSRSCHYTLSFYGLIIQAYFSHLYLISCKIILESAAEGLLRIK